MGFFFDVRSGKVVGETNDPFSAATMTTENKGYRIFFTKLRTAKNRFA